MGGAAHPAIATRPRAPPLSRALFPRFPQGVARAWGDALRPLLRGDRQGASWGHQAAPTSGDRAPRPPAPFPGDATWGAPRRYTRRFAAVELMRSAARRTAFFNPIRRGQIILRYRSRVNDAGAHGRNAGRFRAGARVQRTSARCELHNVSRGHARQSSRLERGRARACLSGAHPCGAARANRCGRIGRCSAVVRGVAEFPASWPCPSGTPGCLIGLLPSRVAGG